ncbi:MAG TPA: hypothetical protein VGM91_19315 [Conexibacter sp.]
MNTAAIVSALQAEPFHSYDDLAARSMTAPPLTHGLYAWWQTAGALPGVPGTPHPSNPAFEILYVGTAPSNATSRRDLQQRLRDHHGAAIGSSTFRLDLTAFLCRSQGWQPGWTTRPQT